MDPATTELTDEQAIEFKVLRKHVSTDMVNSDDVLAGMVAEQSLHQNAKSLGLNSDEIKAEVNAMLAELEASK